MELKTLAFHSGLATSEVTCFLCVLPKVVADCKQYGSTHGTVLATVEVNVVFVARNLEPFSVVLLGQLLIAQ
jgi:hypothetical protein